MKKLSIATVIICTLGLTWAQEVVPAQEPLIKLSRPKHNIFALFDNSASIAIPDIYVSEHFYGYGQPICSKPSNWQQIMNSPQYQNGKYYNPFQSGKYTPYDPINKHPDYDGSIQISECAKVNRAQAFNVLLEQFIYQFNKEYFLGFGGLGGNNTASFSWYTNNHKEYELILQEITDLSTATNLQWAEIQNKINRAFSISATSQSWSPIFPAIYNLSLYFRNYPIPKSSQGIEQGYVYEKHLSPLKYRCAKNNILIFTDGQPNRSLLDVFAKKDVDSNSPEKFSQDLKIAETKEWQPSGQLKVIASYPSLLAANLMNTYYYDHISALGYVEDGYLGYEKQFVDMAGGKFNPNTGYLDPNRFDQASYPIKQEIFQKLISQNLLTGSASPSKQDHTGKAWNATKGIDQTLHINSIVFSETPSKPFTELLVATGGDHIKQQTMDLSIIFENINQLLENSGSLLSFTNGYSIEDQYMRTKDTIRYVFYHNYYTNSGSIRAYTMKDNQYWNDHAEWSTDQKTHPLDGKFITMSYSSSTNKVPNALSIDAISTVFNATYHNKPKIEQINWIVGIPNLNSTTNIKLRPRVSPIGPIVNGKPSFLAKDREYINLNFVSDEMKKSFEDYIKFKAKNLNTELIITGANDGLIHFIQTDRKNNLSQNKGGMRKAAYFPGFLAARLLNITQIDTPFTFTMDGQTNIFEFLGKKGDFISIGITGMGAGGKGLAGYQLFKMSANKQSEQNIKPLFEIVNEDNFAFNTSKFQNLGYTYSGFEFFNQGIPNKKNVGTGIAVFGNGYGNKTSSLYFIDIEDGRLIKEIILNNNGGGASTPALSLIKNPETGLQQLAYLVVGDQSGRLYKVNFSGNDIETATSTIETIYEPDTLFTQPISTRPMLYAADNNGPIWVYFGTGRKADENLDRGIKSKEQQYFIGFPVNSKPTLQQLYKVKYTVQNNIIKLESEDTQDAENKAKLGWYLKLTPSSKKINGNRLAYQPGATAYGDIVFSTWELDEGSDTDLCLEDIGSGYQFALDADTAQKGLFKSNNKSVSGVSMMGTAPGIPSGTTITYLGHLTGAIDHGATSTLSKEAIDELKQLSKVSSHADNTKSLKQCLATTNGESDINIPEFCHDIEEKILTKKRLSIQTLY